jgi:thioredoxin-dependent peroxiredoxin
MVQNGDPAPDFELPADDGSTLRLSALKGQPVVLYFYPKDDTPGCTLEAQDFSELKSRFVAAGAEVIGISPDSVKSHDKFKCKYGLALRLVADEDKVAANAYGVWAEKSMFGKKYMGVERSTFLIGRSGRIVQSWRGVRVAGHAEEVLAAVKASAD